MKSSNHRSAIAVLIILAISGCTDRNMDHIINLWVRASVSDDRGLPISGADVVFQDLDRADQRQELFSVCSTDNSGRCEGRSRYGYNTTQRLWWWEDQLEPRRRDFTMRRLLIHIIADGYEEETVEVRTLTKEQVAGLVPVEVSLRLRRSR